MHVWRAGTLEPENHSGLLDSRQPSPTEVRMRRIWLAVLLGVSFILVPLVGKAQQPGKVYRVGILSSGHEQPPRSAMSIAGGIVVAVEGRRATPGCCARRPRAVHGIHQEDTR